MSQKVREVFEQGQGIFRMMPNFVPRCFSKPGHRLRLHPDDYFALGMKRGAMKERWFSSTIVANNGPYAAEDEGLSYIALNQDGSEKVALRDPGTGRGDHRPRADGYLRRLADVQQIL